MGKKDVDLIKTLQQFKSNLSKNMNISKFILFGSRARGDNKKNSDVDILIVSPDFEGKKSFKRSPSFYLMWNYDYEVDFICLTPEEFNKLKKKVTIVREAVREGIEI